MMVTHKKKLTFSHHAHTGRSELRSCVKVKVEVLVLGSPSLISRVVYLDVEQHLKN